MSALFTLTTDQTIWTPLIPESGTFGIKQSKSKRNGFSIFEQVDASSFLSPATSLKISSKSHGTFKLVTRWNLTCIHHISIILCSLLKAPSLLTIQLFLTSLCQSPKLRSQLWTPADRNLDEAEIPAASPNVFALIPRNSWSKQKQTQTTNQTLAFTEVFSYYPPISSLLVIGAVEILLAECILSCLLKQSVKGSPIQLCHSARLGWLRCTLSQAQVHNSGSTKGGQDLNQAMWSSWNHAQRITYKKLKRITPNPSCIQSQLNTSKNTS